MQEVLPIQAFKHYQDINDKVKKIPILFNEDIAQGDRVYLDDDPDLENSLITGIGCDYGIHAIDPEVSLSTYSYNGITYNVLGTDELNQFTLTLNNDRDILGGKNILEDTPLVTLTNLNSDLIPNSFTPNQIHLYASKFRFTTVESYVKKTGAAVLTPPYCIMLVFSYKSI